MRLPKKFRFNTDEVIVQQLGDAVILVPKESMWQTLWTVWNSFTDDIFEDGRDQASKRSVNICDVYAGHQHLHLRDEEQAGAGIAATEKELNSGVCISSITLAELEYGMKHSPIP